MKKSTLFKVVALFDVLVCLGFYKAFGGNQFVFGGPVTTQGDILRMTQTAQPTATNTLSPTPTPTGSATPSFTPTATVLGQQVASFDSLSGGTTFYFPRVVTAMTFYNNDSAASGALTFTVYNYMGGTSAAPGINLVYASNLFRALCVNYNITGGLLAGNAFVVKPVFTPTQTVVCTISVQPVFAPQ